MAALRAFMVAVRACMLALRACMVAVRACMEAVRVCMLPVRACMVFDRETGTLKAISYRSKIYHMHDQLSGLCKSWNCTF